MSQLATAIFAAISVMCFFWVVLQWHTSRSIINTRIQGLPSNLSFPFKVDTKKSQKDIDDALGLDDSYGDHVSRQLYLAGYRKKRSVRFFHLLLKMAIIFPPVIISYYALTGALTFKTFGYALLSGFFIFIYVNFMLATMRKKRQQMIQRNLPVFFDLMVICLEAGLNFTAALPRVIEEMETKDPITKEFEIMHKEYLNGLSLGQACDRLSRRCEVPDLSVILSSIVESDQMGSSLSAVLRTQAKELRDKHRQRMREKAYKIPVKLLFPIMLIFFTIFIITLGPTIIKLKKILGKELEGSTQSVQGSEHSNTSRQTEAGQQ